MTIRYISLFSGIEAASVAWEHLGWTPVAFSEIEPFPCKVLAYRWPHVPNLGDMTKVDWLSYRGKADLVVGGSPCQAFSVAGLRKSLDDDRGNLTLAYMRAIHAIRPKFFVWENVPGVLNTKDNAFGCFLAGLAGEDAPLTSGGKEGKWDSAGLVSGKEYSMAWRIIDAQYAGVPQRRRRVFLVGHLGDWKPAAKVLFECEGVRRNPPARGKARKGAAGPADAGPDCGGGPKSVDFRNLRIDGDQAGTIQAKKTGGYSLNYQPGIISPTGFGSDAETARTLKAKANSNHDESHETYVHHPIPILEAGARTGKSTDDVRAGIGIGEPGDPMFTLQATKQHAVSVDLRNGKVEDGPTMSLQSGGMGNERGLCPNAIPHVIENDIAHTLRGEGFDASEDGTGRGIPLVPTAFVPKHDEHEGRGANFVETDCAPTLRGPNGTDNTIIAFSSKDHGADAGATSPTLRAGGHNESHPNAGVPPAIAYVEYASCALCHESLRGFEEIASFDPPLCAECPVPKSFGEGMVAKYHCPGCKGQYVAKHQQCPACLAHEPIPFDTTQLTSRLNRSAPKPGDPCHPPAIGFYHTNRNPDDGNYEEKSPTVKVGSGKGGGNPPAVCYDMRGNGDGNTIPTLTGDHASRPTDYTPVVIQTRGSNLGIEEDMTGTLGSNADRASGSAPMVLVQGKEGVDDVKAFQQNQAGEVRVGDKAGTLNTNSNPSGRNTPMVVFSLMPQNSGKDFKAREVDVVQPLMAAGPGGGNQGGDVVIQPDITMAVKDDVTPKVGGETAFTLTTPSPSGGGHPQAVLSRACVRRLTPRECERLQDFPDDYTLIPGWGHKKIGPTSMAEHLEVVAYLLQSDYTQEEAEALAKTPDGPRYKAMGNSMAACCMAWIGEGIQLVEEESREVRA